MCRDQILKRLARSYAGNSGSDLRKADSFVAVGVLASAAVVLSAWLWSAMDPVVLEARINAKR